MIEIETGDKMHVVGDIMEVIEVGFQAAAGGGWWDDYGAVACCVGAYQGRNATNYAASLVNLANPGTNDLTEIGGGAPGWNAAQGWFNFLTLNRCLDTGLVPALTWSMLAQYANHTPTNNIFIGCTSGGATRFYIAGRFLGANVRYAVGGGLSVPPQLITGNAGIAANQGYRNGLADGGLIPGGANPAHSIYLGATNNAGVAAFWVNLDLWAVAIYNCTLNAAEVAAVAAGMAAI